ncbi:CTP synthase [Treponema sp.]|uniref:CTP synthase n=1 Tax=Treponema sp. TaxID=166 RepID=UPI0025E89F2E|nr:CTP synthase [Treponema sp.]MCR5218868.1 CTP synthase [Treponema sp.]
MSKYILVTSGVCSSLGKGVASSTIASLLESSGLKVAMMKCDPYINVDAGNISPYQHGEVYVTEDGAETDLDLGNFSRFTNINLTNENCISIGKVYENVIRNERAGRYNGRTVQVIPHITDEIKRCIRHIGTTSGADVVVVEIGGTVGDIEAVPYLEASRQFARELGKENVISIHLTLIPVITGGELKSKPTQNSVKQLQQVGIQPDILICRCEAPVEDSLKKKIAQFCNVSAESVFVSPDVEKSIYELPVIFHEQKIDSVILNKLKITNKKTDVRQWTDFLKKLNNPKSSVTIALVGKKDYLDNCYKSVQESLFHAAVTGNNSELIIKKIDAETLEKSTEIDSFFNDADGIVIPGSYGQRGFLGLIKTVTYAREHKIPYLGIDLGMQLMAIETGRNLCNWEDADTTEFMSNSTHPVISLPEEQQGPSDGGIKLGSSSVKLTEGSKLHSIYKTAVITERHRSKYAFDRHYTKDMEDNGLTITAMSVSDNQAEAFEWNNHPWGIGVQYHPEFVSRPAKPHPLFNSFILAALDNHKK